MNKCAENTIHDVLYEITGASHNSRSCLNVYCTMPESIRSMGEEWGWSDTEVREAIADFASELFDSDEDEE